MKNPFSKQYRYVTNHLHQYVSNSFLNAHLPSYCFTMCFTLVDVNISSNTTFTPDVIFCPISTGPMDLFIYILVSTFNSKLVLLVSTRMLHDLHLLRM